jgi:hypothetical protein
VILRYKWWKEWPLKCVKYDRTCSKQKSSMCLLVPQKDRGPSGGQRRHDNDKFEVEGHETRFVKAYQIEWDQRGSRGEYVFKIPHEGRRAKCGGNHMRGDFQILFGKARFVKTVSDRMRPVGFTRGIHWGQRGSYLAGTL